MIDITTFEKKKKKNQDPGKVERDYREIFWKAEKKGFYSRCSDEQKDLLNTIVGWNNDLWQILRKEQRRGWWDFDSIKVEETKSDFENKTPGYVGVMSGNLIVKYRGSIAVDGVTYYRDYTKSLDTRGFW